jgi:hypothetical protein
MNDILDDYFVMLYGKMSHAQLKQLRTQIVTSMNLDPDPEHQAEIRLFIVQFDEYVNKRFVKKEMS